MSNNSFKKELVIGIIVLFFSMNITPSVAIDTVQISLMSISPGNTLYVGGSGPGNYTKIQYAVENASDGDTIFVYKGSYFENLYLDKTIYLIGEDRNKTIIYPKNIYENENSIVNIHADNCTIDGFTVRNLDFEEDVIGFFINSSGNKINGNIITKLQYGIYLRNDVINEPGFTQNKISNNEVINCTFGIYLRAIGKNNEIYNNNIIDNDEGIFIYYLINNSIVGNFVHSNRVYGIYISTDSDGNIISRNICTENMYAIRFKGVSNNEIYLNWLEGNTQGLYSCCSSYGNTIYKNTCINNTKHASDGYDNNWDNGEIGNYWDDYNGTDSNGDGIGDTPYPIPDGNNEDRYPLMEPWLENKPPEAPTIDGPTKCKPGKEYDYSFVAIDPDEDHVWYHICWGDKEIIYIYGPYPSGRELKLSYKWTNKGNYTITCWARDIYNEVSNVSMLEVTVPRNRIYCTSLFQWLCERFSMLERLQNLLRFQ